jgi:hypothetical protein
MQSRNTEYKRLVHVSRVDEAKQDVNERSISSGLRLRAVRASSYSTD